ncbi:TonB-dependent receptor family protein [Flavihumibacter profundi]|jgi:Fe(3+) dicitrate transport protein|uniref:TonB-dependent receptor family protein n=1 Tax=Flavihumibacter profundi TaxID=2716883 RepID=UPI001CC3F54E|nr:TonB-dependent receptor [Flavihumibacter profundi]MBZ5857950.1 TonB-dependent receptor [Flavihumibacter profundi]
MRKITTTFLVVLGSQLMAQEKNQVDTTVSIKVLDSISITAFQKQNLVGKLPDIKGTFIFSGKKSESINLAQAPSNLPDKIGRQVFAKIPGVFVYDMDGSGNQINIATRGLDPHRGWEFNIRKDGIITNSDLYGYPASHFSMPLESIERIELVRGTGSLQYGAQFGGMLNYVSKQGDSSKAFNFESINNAGSFNLLSTYNAIGGKLGKFRYYAYMSRKSRNGYRDNEHTESENQSIAIDYTPNRDFSLRLEWSRSAYLYKIPGQLNDSLFKEDPTQSTRNRNYFNPDIHIPSINLNWQISKLTRLQFTSSAVLGTRNSVLFDKPANIKDSINPLTLQYSNRQVDIDHFNSYTTELRILQEYHSGKQISALTAGIQYMNNDLHRNQLGKGTTGSDFDLTLVTPGWGRDLHFKTKNIALFAENRLQLSKSLSVGTGVRLEMGQTDMSGQITYYPDNELPVTIKHQFPLLGLNISYKPGKFTEFYGGASQAYRPMIFKDIIPASTYEKVDPNIKDSKGYNAELGFRGSRKFISWDINGYVLNYKNRFGTLIQTGDQGEFYTYRTNIGNSLTIGGEFFIQADWMLGRKTGLSIFTSTAIIHARYTTATVKSGLENIDISGNKVESAPDLISRNGVTFRYEKFNISGLMSFTSESFADPLNTVAPAPRTGAVGIVPSYNIIDLNAGYHFSKNLEARISISNLTNKDYFTKRPAFYPGPGIWPSDGRNFCFTIMIRI